MNTRYVMGTFLSVRIMAEDNARLTQIFFEEIQRLEELLSLYKPESDISRINRAAGIAPVAVASNTFEVVTKALHYAKKSDGAFDPTLQPSGYRHVLLNPAKKTIFLRNSGMKLDLGGIGKGYALDVALAHVKREGSPAFVYANFGGQLLFWHASGSFKPETIWIENPERKGDVLSTFQINSNCSISTSSNAERPHHLRNPQTGEPAAGQRSITVVAPNGTEAEAWSTALFVSGKTNQSTEIRGLEPRVQFTTERDSTCLQDKDSSELFYLLAG